MASRVVPASGAVSSRSSPISRLTSVDLPAFGPPDNGDADRMRAAIGSAAASICCRGVLRQCRAQRVVEIGQALVVLGGNRDRIAEAERIGFEPPASPAVPSILLAISTAGLPDLRDELGEDAVEPASGRCAHRS